MNIAIAIENFFQASGGNERSTMQITRQLTGRGHRVTILANQGDLAPDLGEGGVAVYADGPSTKYAVGLGRFRKWAWRRLEAGGFDATISMTTAVPAMVLQPRAGLTRELLDRGIAMYPSRLQRGVRRLALAFNAKRQALLRAERSTLADPAVRKIVAISHYVADQLKHHYDVATSRIEYIPNAAEIVRFAPDTRRQVREQVRGELELGEGQTAFLFAGMDAKRKGLSKLVEAFDRLGRDDAVLVVAGAKPEGLVQKCAAGPLAGRVRWLGRSDQTDSLYVACDVTVLPSWSDAAAKVVLESLLHGTPAISTLYNGTSQWIFDPTGIDRMPSAFGPTAPAQQLSGAAPAGRVVTSPEDVPGLAQAMAELCDPGVRSACAAATEGIDEHVTMARHVDRLEALLLDV